MRLALDLKMTLTELDEMPATDFQTFLEFYAWRAKEEAKNAKK